MHDILVALAFIAMVASPAFSPPFQRRDRRRRLSLERSTIPCLCGLRRVPFLDEKALEAVASGYSNCGTAQVRLQGLLGRCGHAGRSG